MSARRYHEVKEDSPTQYKYVRKKLYHNGEVSYIARFETRYKGKRRATSKEYATEREAAIAVDKFRITKGLEPINILKKKEE